MKSQFLGNLIVDSPVWQFARSLLLKCEKADKFKTLFREVSMFDRPVEFWNDSVNSTFNKHCKYVMECFSRKWPTPGSKEEYCMFFSTCNWKDLAFDVKKSHSLSQCITCVKVHMKHQKA